MEDYKEKYEQALEKAKICYKDLSNLDGVVATMSKDFFEEVFPELKESEDERVRKELINFFKNHMDSVYEEISDNNVVIAWLEKQGEQRIISKTEPIVEGLTTEFQKQVSHLIASAMNKEHEYTKGYVEWVAQSLLGYAKNELTSTDEIKPKFKVGDWIINSEGMLRHILAVDKTGYQTDYGWLTHDIYDNTYHLWTIQDAKDGDVLSFSDDTIIIFKNLYNNSSFHAYCYIEGGVFDISAISTTTPSWWDSNGFVPATKEQRDLLFQKMKEAGYEWDAEKKELKKIERKPVVIIPKFHEGDVIKPKDGGHEPWKIMQVDISDKKYRFKDGYVIHFSQENDYELVEQKPTWSEEDEQHLKEVIFNMHWAIKNCVDKEYAEKEIEKHIDWLKSLKERYTWKPNRRQIEAIEDAIKFLGCTKKVREDLKSLYEQLKKLREE